MNSEQDGKNNAIIAYYDINKDSSFFEVIFTTGQQKKIADKRRIKLGEKIIFMFNLRI